VGVVSQIMPANDNTPELNLCDILTQSDGVCKVKTLQTPSLCVRMSAWILYCEINWRHCIVN